MMFSATICRTVRFLNCQVGPLDLLLQVQVETVYKRATGVHESIDILSCLVCCLQQAALHSHTHLQPGTAVRLPLCSQCSKTRLALVMSLPQSLIRIVHLIPRYPAYLVKVSAASIWQFTCSHMHRTLRVCESCYLRTTGGHQVYYAASDMLDSTTSYASKLHLVPFALVMGQRCYLAC